MNHANLGALGGMNWTPLHLAACYREEVVVLALLQCGADPSVGWTPAHLAALQGNTAILKVLVKAGAQLDVQDGVGCTPLQLALRSQKQGTMAFLEGKEPPLAILGGAELGTPTEV
uniref:Uncharacterized protein n=1 Tax=Marmota marmota marmota TaxID=9994 RepID=A0A8C6AB09_MARMA